MNVSAITLDILDAAVVNTLTDASPAEQGQLLADLIIKFHGEQQAEQPPEPKPLKRVKVKHNPKSRKVKRNRPKRYGANMYAPLRFGGRTHGKPTYR